MIAPAQWPDASTEPPPADHSYGSAVWLLSRHPMLSALAQRIPDVITEDDEGLFLDQFALSEAIAKYDFISTRAGTMSEREYDEQLGTGAHAFAHMSRTEQTRLRLLAFFGSSRVGLHVGDMHGLDAGGQLLLADWTAAVLAA